MEPIVRVTSDTAALQAARCKFIELRKEEHVEPRVVNAHFSPANPVTAAFAQNLHEPPWISSLSVFWQTSLVDSIIG